MVKSFFKSVLFTAIGQTLHISTKDILKIHVDVSEEQLPVMLRKQAI